MKLPRRQINQFHLMLVIVSARIDQIAQYNVRVQIEALGNGADAIGAKCPLRVDESDLATVMACVRAKLELDIKKPLLSDIPSPV